ncbi:MAG: hypothetical protein AB7F76_17770 [Parvibaculaceae bacterium]
MAAWRKLRSTRSGDALAAIIFLLAVTLHAVAGSATASAAELLMFEEAGCPWCIKWHKEVGPAYSRSPEGKRAPLRRLDIRAAVPAGVRLDKPVRATPTFVLIEQGREVGRITGYPGPDFFWGLLEEMMRKLSPFDQPKSAGMRAAFLANPAWRSM